MEANRPSQRLSDISTLWTILYEAHSESEDAVTAAQRALLDRYSPAIRRYLLGATRDADTADELFQDFALRFVRGDFRNANPQRGRFRDFLKRVLANLVTDDQRRRQRQPEPLDEALHDPANEASTIIEPEADRAFRTLWRAELLARTWTGLKHVERDTGQPLYTVLRLRTDHPDESAEALATRLTPQFDPAPTAAWVRKRLHQAREKFREILLDEVAQTLVRPTVQDMEEELLELGLHEYCRDALRRRGGA